MKPTIGRIVHFHTDSTPKPCSAMVIDDEPPASSPDNPMIMLQVFANNGGRFHELLQAEPEKPNRQGHFWKWPPRD